MGPFLRNLQEPPLFTFADHGWLMAAIRNIRFYKVERFIQCFSASSIEVAPWRVLTCQRLPSTFPWLLMSLTQRLFPFQLKYQMALSKLITDDMTIGLCDASVAFPNSHSS